MLCVESGRAERPSGSSGRHGQLRSACLLLLFQGLPGSSFPAPPDLCRPPLWPPHGSVRDLMAFPLGLPCPPSAPTPNTTAVSHARSHTHTCVRTHTAHTCTHTHTRLSPGPTQVVQGPLRLPPVDKAHHGLSLPRARVLTAAWAQAGVLGLCHPSLSQAAPSLLEHGLYQPNPQLLTGKEASNCHPRLCSSFVSGPFTSVTNG